MNILFATHNCYLPQAGGGTEASTHDLCNSIKKASLNCAVLADLKPNEFLYFKNRVKSKLTASQFPSDNTLGYPVFRGWNPLLGIPEVIRKFRPDIVIVQSGIPVLMANEFLKNNVKTIIYIRDM